MCLCSQAELSLSQRRVCNELSRLKGEEIEEMVGAGDTNTPLGPTLQVQYVCICVHLCVFIQSRIIAIQRKYTITVCTTVLTCRGHTVRRGCVLRSSI